MSNLVTKLTRNQLAEFLPNARAVRAFEQLLAQIAEINPDELITVKDVAQAAALEAGTGTSKAQSALDEIARLAAAVELVAAMPPAPQNNSIATDYIDLPENGPHVTQERRIQWNANDGTLDVGLYNGVVLQTGQELHYYAKNTSGGTISNGSPVMFTGAVGASGKLTFGPAIADGSVPASYMMGVATQDVANNAFGYVTSFGLVRGINTTGTPYGETWADGDLLYFSPTTPGGWTNVQPSAPAISVPVAVVVHAGGGASGSIFVRMENGQKLTELQDVLVTSLAGGDMLQYNATAQRWENTKTPLVSAPTPAAVSAAATLTNADLLTRIISTTGATYTITMPLGTTLETLVSWPAVDLGYDFTVINTATGTITMAVNTGVTSLGSLTIATGTSAQFRIRRTAANTFILYRLS